ncbi:MAG: phospho-sugar mutase, partial [Acutalibacteraceae bacterium]|nr:phospho-sugar mutase [Acutalibacteraceae bacterium]
LGGSYVRDKDAVFASMLICEMTAYYKQQGKSLIEVLEALYKKYGYFICSQKSYTCEGESGIEQIKGAMNNLRKNMPIMINAKKVLKVEDYANSICYDLKNNAERKITLPRSDVLCYYLEDGSSLIVRPSGTEPKIKLYLNSIGETREKAEINLENLTNSSIKIFGF